MIEISVQVHTFLREDVDILYPQSQHPTYQLGVRFQFRGRNHTLGFSPQGTPGRKTMGGPMIDDLFGWLNAEASVIAAHHIPDPRPVCPLVMGDAIVVEGYGTFVLTKPRWSDDAPLLVAYPWPVSE